MSVNVEMYKLSRLICR